MQIDRGAYVVFAYRLFLDTGEPLELQEEGQRIGFIVGQGHLWPAVERQLIGMEPGQSATVYLEPGEAFGEYDPSAVREVPRDRFPSHIELRPTMPFQATGPQGPVTFVIRAVGEEMVTVDLNHPLAGRRLRCEIRVYEVRRLSERERALIVGEFPPMTISLGTDEKQPVP